MLLRINSLDCSDASSPADKWYNKTFFASRPSSANTFFTSIVAPRTRLPHLSITHKITILKNQQIKRSQNALIYGAILAKV